MLVSGRSEGEIIVCLNHDYWMCAWRAREVAVVVVADARCVESGGSR